MLLVLNPFQSKLSGGGSERRQGTSCLRQGHLTRAWTLAMKSLAGQFCLRGTSPWERGPVLHNWLASPERGEEAGVCRSCEIFLRTDLEFGLLRASGSKTRSCSHKEVPPAPLERELSYTSSFWMLVRWLHFQKNDHHLWWPEQLESPGHHETLPRMLCSNLASTEKSLGKIRRWLKDWKMGTLKPGWRHYLVPRKES